MLGRRTLFIGHRGTGLPRDLSGTTILEFALVGPLFLLMLLAILQFSLRLFAQMSFDNAVLITSRAVRLGTIGLSSPAVTSSICDNVSGLIDHCSAKLVVTTSSGPSFAAQVNGLPAASGSFAVITATYNLNYLIPWIGQLISPTTNTIALVSRIAFENEPY